MDLEEYRFPLFVDLKGRRAVVVGGGRIALRRAQVLCSFGAAVTIIAPHCGTLPEGVAYQPRAYVPGDLEGAFLAVAATDDRKVNRQIGQHARQLGIFVSVADSKDESTFFFPAVCTGNGLVCGVVSKGTEHHKTAQAARWIRAGLEEME